MLIQEQSIRSLDLSELDLDNEDGAKKLVGIDEEKSTAGEIEEHSEIDEVIEKKKLETEKKPQIDENTFDKFLDIMEVF